MNPAGVLLVILGALHSSTAAQVDAWARMERLLRPGDQLIVESLTGSTAAGALVGVDVGRIAIWSHGHTREFARNDVSRVTRLRRTNGRAPLIGALVGGAIGAGLAASYQDFDPGGRLLITAIGAGAGGGLGVLIGRRRVPEIVYLAHGQP